MDSLLVFIQSGASAFLPFIILLGLLIFVHELGHFAIAKYNGVRVEVFSLGFGKKILQFKWGETIYCISLIPLGGYVKMFGEDPNADISPEEKAVSYTHKTVGQRIAIVLAGPLMNLFFAAFIFILIAFVGNDDRAPVLGDIPAASSAHQAGFQSGDRILEVENQKVRSFTEFNEVIQAHPHRDLQATVQREKTGEEERIFFTPELGPNPNILSARREVGIVQGISASSIASIIGVEHGSLAYQAGLRTGDRIIEANGESVQHWRELERILERGSAEWSFQAQRFSDGQEPEVLSFEIQATESGFESIGIEKADLWLDQVIRDSPAAQAGLQSGDRITHINGEAVKSWETVVASIQAFDVDQDHLAVGILRQGQPKELKMVPRLISSPSASGLQERRYMVGIQPSLRMSEPELVTIQADSVVGGLLGGLERTWEVTAMIGVSLVRLVSGEISPRNIGGVISIGQVASETFQIGLVQFLQMMGIISINLFILNLLPIPVLDGGHLVFYTIEALKGSPLSMKNIQLAHQIGLFLLLSLMAFALFNDFSRLLSPW